MQYQKKVISYFLMLCLVISALYADKAIVVSAKTTSKIKVRLKIENRTVSGKTISVKKNKKKNIKVVIPKKKNYKIKFHSNRPHIVSVSKTGKIKAKSVGTAKVTVTAKAKKKKYKSWIKIRVVSSGKKKEDTPPTGLPVSTPTAKPTVPVTPLPSDTPGIVPTVTPPSSATPLPSDAPEIEPSTEPGKLPAEGDISDKEDVSDMHSITIRVNGKAFLAKLYQTKTTEALMQKLPLSITMNELNGNEKYYYFSENLPIESQKVSEIHAGDLKLYGSSCLVLFYENFATSYSYTSLGYVENPEGLAEVLGKGNVSVEIVGSDE